MKEYIPVIASVIAGIFAVISAYIAWRLKISSDKYRDETILAKEKYKEKKLLYTNTFEVFERAIREIQNGEEFTLSQNFSENNAKIHLLAPNTVINQYSKTTDLLKSWSSLYAKTLPHQMKMGGQIVTIHQWPDPSAETKGLAQNEYQKLKGSLQKLVELMRVELENSV